MERQVEAVPEQVVGLRVNDVPVATWSCSPHALRALGAGRLLALGFIQGVEDVLGMEVHDGELRHTISARVPADRFAAAMDEREHRKSHGCGLHYLIECAPKRLDGDDGNDRHREHPPLDAFPDLFRALFGESETRRSTGGHHTAALSDGHELLHLHEEVGRHNAADKAIGSALLEGLPLDQLGLVTTARISGEMAEKAARARLAWVASRSVPTTLAVEVARAAGVALIARAPTPDARVLTGGTDS